MYKFNSIHSIKAVILILFLIIPGITRSQVPTPARSDGYWLSYSGDNKISKKWGIHSELQLRNYFLHHSVATTLSRVGVNYYLNPNSMMTLGYGFIHMSPSSDEVLASSINEHRIWQQLLMRQKFGFLNLDHRYRLEQRFTNNLTSNKKRTEHRIRYRVNSSLPLKNLNTKLNDFYLAFNNEIFLNFHKDANRTTDRNRMFVGLGYNVNRNLNMQLGFMNQWIYLPNQGSSTTDKLGILGFTYNVNFVKPSDNV